VLPPGHLPRPGEPARRHGIPQEATRLFSRDDTLIPMIPPPPVCPPAPGTLLSRRFALCITLRSLGHPGSGPVDSTGRRSAPEAPADAEARTVATGESVVQSAAPSGQARFLRSGAVRFAARVAAGIVAAQVVISLAGY